MPGKQVRYTKEEWRRAKWELYRFLNYRGADNFDVCLYALIAKASIDNRIRLHAGFPCYVDCYLEWQDSDPREFFSDLSRPQ